MGRSLLRVEPPGEEPHEGRASWGGASWGRTLGWSLLREEPHGGRAPDPF